MTTRMVQSTLRSLVAALLAPNAISASTPAAPVILSVLGLFGLLLGIGLLFSPIASVQPAAVFFIGYAFWGILVIVLVVCASLAGLEMSWQEGAKLLSLSTLPLLLRLLIGDVFSAITTLSPFLVGMNPRLFWSGAPIWTTRIDLFEIWSVTLLWLWLKNVPEGTPQKAASIVFVVWVFGFILAFVLGSCG